MSGSYDEYQTVSAPTGRGSESSDGFTGPTKAADYNSPIFQSWRTSLGFKEVDPNSFQTDLMFIQAVRDRVNPRDTLYTNQNLTASSVVRSRSADCGGTSLVLEALYRSYNIPARSLIGWVYKNKQWLGHCKVERWYQGHWIQVEGSMLKGQVGLHQLGNSKDFFPFLTAHFGFGVTDAEPVNPKVQSPLKVLTMREPVGGIFARPPGWYRNNTLMLVKVSEPDPTSSNVRFNGQQGGQ